METSEQSGEYVPPQETALAKRQQEQPPPPPTRTPNYMDGFDGMATKPFEEKTIKALTAPIESSMVEVKPDGIVYLPGVFYRQRLTEAFGPGGWALAPRGPARVMGNVVTYHGALYALGRFVSEAVGENAYHANNDNMSYASALEGARTDAVTRCCKDLLVAKELWDPGWRAKWLEAWALKAWLTKEQVGPRAQKGKWIYWRKDRETPWQVTKAKARPQPAVTSPEPEEGEDPPKQETKPAPPADPNAKATEAELDGLAKEFKDAQWKSQHIRNWVKKHWGCGPDDLTSGQVATARELLASWRADYSSGEEKHYAAKVAELQAAGRIRKEAA